MSTVVDISLFNLLAFVALLLIPLFVLQSWKLVDVNKDMITSVSRMVVQLLLVGLYLKYLFELNNIVVNLLWLTVMITVANTSIVRRAGLCSTRLLVITQVSLLCAVAFVVGLFLVGSGAAGFLFRCPLPDSCHRYAARELLTGKYYCAGSVFSVNSKTMKRLTWPTCSWVQL